ncbi:MAG: DUF4245 domain-containing protein [Actinomycetales bacterium]
MTQVDQARSSRDIARKNALDMVRSLAVIGAVVVVIYLLVPRPSATFVPSADVTAAAAAAESIGGVQVIVPEVPDDWQVTSARREGAVDGMPVSWHIGYLTGSGEYAGMKITDEANDLWVADATLDGSDVRSPLDIEGRQWQTWVAEQDGRISLVQGSLGGPMVVVSGTADHGELVELATAIDSAQ